MAHSTASHQDLLHQCGSGGFSSCVDWRETDDLATSERRELHCDVDGDGALEGNLDGG